MSLSELHNSIEASPDSEAAFTVDGPYLESELPKAPSQSAAAESESVPVSKDVEKKESNPPLVSAPSPSPTAWLWQSPSNKVAVYLDFDLVDRLNFDIMRGFGAVPRRGAEVGGLLLGSYEPGNISIVRLEDYIQIPCEHMRGPSYILSERDLEVLEDQRIRWSAAPDKRLYIVGFFRSNTRDAMVLAPEDRALLDARFTSGHFICLMVRPFATRVSEGTFFVRENERWPDGPQTTFMFRRKEMGGGLPGSRPGRRSPPPDAFGSAPTPGPASDPTSAQEAGFVPPHLPSHDPDFGVPTFGGLAPSHPEEPALENAAEREAGDAPRSKFRSGWVWIPLSFIFLLLGVVLGFQIALSYRGSAKAVEALTDPYNLDLSVVKFGESLHLKWNTGTLALTRAQKGVLTIQDGDSVKTVELSRDDLSRGSVLYPHTTETVRFRLEVFPRDNNSVSETVDLRLIR